MEIGESNKVHQNVWPHVSFLIFYGSPMGHIILAPKVILGLVTKILIPTEVLLCSQSEFQRTRNYCSVCSIV